MKKHATYKRKCQQVENVLKTKTFLTFYLIQPLSWGRGVGLRWGVSKRGWFSVTRGTGKKGGRKFVNYILAYFIFSCKYFPPY